MPDGTAVAERLTMAANPHLTRSSRDIHASGTTNSRPARLPRPGIVERQLAAMEARDLGAILDCFAQDAVIVDPTGTYTGQEEVETYHRAIFEPFSDLRLEAEIRANDGATIVGEAVMSGTHSGPLPLPGGESLPPTGRRFSLRLVDVVTIVEGRVARKDIYYDNLDFLRQLGVLDANSEA